MIVSAISLVRDTDPRGRPRFFFGTGDGSGSTNGGESALSSHERWRPGGRCADEPRISRWLRARERTRAPARPHYTAVMLRCPRCGRGNPEGNRFCGRCGAPLGGAPDETREERKVVSVLFCDLVGFTSRS